MSQAQLGPILLVPGTNGLGEVRERNEKNLRGPKVVRGGRGLGKSKV